MAINWIQYPDSLTFNTSDKIIVSSPDGNTKNLSFPFTSSSSGITFNSDTYFTNLTETNETNGLVIDANGKLSYRANVDEHATHIYENVRNDEGSTIPAGTPVYSKGEIGGSERIKVGIAKANDPTKMPAIGITNTELTTAGDTKDGLITIVGVYNNNLSGFTGLSTNQIVYVAPTGGLTITKPTGVNLIQNVGIILKTNSTIIQGLQVTCIGRTNDVPNPLAIDHANQRLGIGTSSPSEKLQVDGNVRLSNSSKLFLWADHDLNFLQYYRWQSYTSLLMQISNAGTGGVGFFTSGSERARITSNGNVGIGTSGPSVPLEVYASGTDKLKLTDDDGSNVVFGIGGNLFSHDLSASAQYRIRINNSEKIRLDSTGNLGINTSFPASKLDIRGTVQVGVDDTGHDVIFYGATSGKKMHWDESADKLIVDGTLDVNGPFEIDKTLTMSHTADPSDPATGKSVMWSDTSGNLKIKINVAGSVVTRTLAAYED